MGSIYLFGLFSFVLYPIYSVFSLFWVQDMFDETYKIWMEKNQVKVKLKKISFLDALANLVFRKGVYLMFSVQMAFFIFLPYPLGDIISFILNNWLYSYYCFEYKILALNMTTEESIKIFESNWAYYWGFGLPFGIVLYLFPGLMGVGIFAFLFPFLVIQSVEATPPSNDKVLERCKEKLVKNNIKKSLLVLEKTVRHEFGDAYLLRKSIQQTDTGMIPSRIPMFYVPIKLYSFITHRLQKYIKIN